MLRSSSVSRRPQAVLPLTKSPALAKPTLQPLRPNTFDPTQSSTRSRSVEVVFTPSRSSETASADLITWDRCFDRFLEKCETTRPCLALEQTLQRFLDTEKTIYWDSAQIVGFLHAPTYNVRTSNSTGLPGKCYASKQPLTAALPPSHPSFSPDLDGQLIPGGCAADLFPLRDRGSEIVAIIEIVRRVPLTPSELHFTEWFARRFQLVYHWLDAPPPIDGVARELLVCEKLDVFRAQVFPKIAEDFDAREVELWRAGDGQGMQRYAVAGCEQVRTESGGVVGRAIAQLCVVNGPAAEDGSGSDSLLALPLRIEQSVWCPVLRRRTPFSQNDEVRLRRVAPLLVRAFLNAEQYILDSASDMRKEVDLLQSLLRVLVSISSVMNHDAFLQMVMDGCQGLVKADRCSLFLLNDAHDRLVSQVHTGLSSPIELSLESGIAGRAFSQRSVVNVADAYDSRIFDCSVDIRTKFATKSIVAVPIFNQHGAVLGCSEFLNKLNGEMFTEADVKLIELFNAFCGISIENSRLYQNSVEMHRRMSSLLDTAFSFSKSENIHDMLSGILQNVKELIRAERASVFAVDANSSVLTSLIVDGSKFPTSVPAEHGLTGMAARSKVPIVENDCYSNPEFNRSFDQETGFTTRSLIAHPILDAAGVVIGVVEVLNKQDGPFTSHDVETVSAFATLAAFALQNQRMDSIIEVVGPDAELGKWISAEERNAFVVPKLLELTAEEKATVLSINCFAPNFHGIGHFKEIFFFFNLFNFLEVFQVTAEKLFRFLSGISSRYTGTSYHNWTHACDVTQCVVFNLYVGKLGEAYECWELFTLMVAAICHDTNHQGFNNVYNVKAETPLGLLYKDQSVMEMHHITQAIPVINRDDIELFHSFDQQQVKKVWSLFIRIILSTDMAHHFELVKRAQAAVDEDSFDMTNPDFRLLGLQLIMKVGDISNVSRPFELADKWCDILNEEFFHQGDLEKQTGIGFTSPLNNREGSNKPKSQIGFYNFICLPLYTVVARLFPPLQVQVDSIKANLDKWKALAAAQRA